MATQVQLRRGTATENNSFTGAQGELSYDTTNKRVRVHDGATAGGFELKTENSSGDTLFADNEKAIFGAGSDLQIYHNANNSYIQDVGTGKLHITSDGTGVSIDKGTSELMATFDIDGAVTLYHDNSQKLATTSTGIDVTGNATFADNGKAIFGAGSDLQIYHDGSNSYVEDTATGSLILKGANVLVRDSSDNNIMKANDGGSAVLFYAGSSKLATSSSGVDISGTLTSDGLTVDTSATGGFKVEDHPTLAGTILTSYQGTINSNVRTLELAGQQLYVSTGSPTGTTTTDRLHVSFDGDISFYEDTGTTPKFFWDASAESLGIGTSSPSVPLHVNTSGTSMARFVGGNDGNLYITNDSANVVTLQAAGGDALSFNTNGGNERMRIDASGNLLLGKTASDYSTTGTQLSSNGQVTFTSDGNTTLQINRKTSDGVIQRFSKDGTTVGSIGVQSTGFYIDGENGHAGIRFAGNEVSPRNGGSDADGTVSLGESDKRFKDLYLSGGIEIENGTGNVGVGKQALNSNTADSNTAVGCQAGYTNVSGRSNTFIGNDAGEVSTSSFNTYIGKDAGKLITSGQKNTILGSYNGNQGGLDIRTSSNRIVLSDGDGNPRIYVNSSGQVALGGTTISTGYRVSINSTQAALIGIRTSSSDGDLVQALSWDTSGFATRFYVAASGAGPNGGATALSIGRNNSTNRSINASGTINASGSDYAEYMVKTDTAETINKGDVCGIDVNGKLTTVWADAISFVVKSTDPSYVGGDTWFNDEERPNKDEVTAEEYAAFEERLEAARATVDRIAFSGQVPVNVTGATVGDFIVPVQDGTGITGQAVSSPTLEQYMSAVGKVIAIEDDGRAKIIVKVA